MLRKKLNLITLTLYILVASACLINEIHSLRTLDMNYALIMLLQCLYTLCSKLLAIVFCAIFALSFVFRPFLYTHSSFFFFLPHRSLGMCVCVCVCVCCDCHCHCKFHHRWTLWMQTVWKVQCLCFRYFVMISINIYTQNKKIPPNCLYYLKHSIGRMSVVIAKYEWIDEYYNSFYGNRLWTGEFSHHLRKERRYEYTS